MTAGFGITKSEISLGGDPGKPKIFDTKYFLHWLIGKPRSGFLADSAPGYAKLA